MLGFWYFSTIQFKIMFPRIDPKIAKPTIINESWREIAPSIMNCDNTWDIVKMFEAALVTATAPGVNP